MATIQHDRGDEGDEFNQAEPARLPPFLRLSTELLDRIVQLAVPLSSPRLARRRLASLLLVHPLLVPIVRRTLYRKVNLVVGDPLHQSDLKLLALLQGNPRTRAGLYVQYLRLRVPDPPDGVVLHPGQDPAFALLPRPHLGPTETLALVSRAVNLVPNVRHIEINLQVGCALEDDATGDTAAAHDHDHDHGALESFEQGMKRWSTRLETCVSAVEDPKQRLQIWADTARISPHVRALAEWDNLTRLDLWRVRLVLPRNGPSTATLGEEEACRHLALPTPNFRLRELVLTQCELGGRFELEWLLGGSTDPANTARSLRSAQLKKLVLDQIEFVETPESSAPIRAALFPSPGAEATVLPPPFADTLEHLALVLPYPIVSQDGLSTSDDLLAGLTALKIVELGGPGVDEPLLASLFGAIQTDTTSSTPDRQRPPSTTVRDLSLNYLTLISVSTILSHFENTTSAARGSNDFAKHPLRDLDNLTFKTSWDLPRRWSWEQRQRTREPVWYQIHLYSEQLGEDPRATGVATSNATAQDVEATRRNRQGWDEVQKTVKAFVKERNRLSIRAGISSCSRAPLRLFKNRLECTYDEEASDDEEEDEEDDDDGDEAGSADDRGDRSASEMDMNALFVPSSGDEEDQNAWVRRRLEEEEDYESDF